MKNLIKSVSQSIRRRKFYYSLFFYSILLVVLLVCTVSTVSFSILGKKYEEEIRRSDRHILGQVMYYTDQNLYACAMQLINDYILNDYFAIGLSRFYSAGIPSGFNSYKYHQTLSGLQTKDEFIQSITLYRKKEDFLIDSRYGLGLSASEDAVNIDRFFPFSEYLTFVSNQGNACIATPEEFGNGSWPYLTWFRSVPLYSRFEDGTGFFAIAFRPEILWNNIEKAYRFEGNLMILDENGRILLDNLGRKEEGERLREKVLDIGFDDPSYFDDFKLNSTKYGMTWMVSPDSGWCYVSITPMRTLVADSIAANQKVAFLAAGVMITSFILVRSISRRLYRPVNRLRQHAVHGGIAAESQDDISAIHDTLSFFEEKVDDMQKAIEANADVIVYRAMSGLTRGTYQSESEILERFYVAGIPFGRSCFRYCLVDARIEDTIFKSLNLEQQEYLNVKFRDFMKQKAPEGVVLATESMDTGRITTVLNLNELSYQDLLARKCSLLGALQSELHVTLNLLISDSAENLACITELFRQTGEGLEYSYLCGYGTVFSLEELKSRDNKPFAVGSAKFYDFEAGIQMGRCEKAIALLTEWEREISEGEYSCQSVRNFLNQLYGIFMRVESEDGILAHSGEKETLAKAFQEASYYREGFYCLEALLGLYQETLAPKSGEKKLITEIMNYVKTHCGQEISLSVLANRFQISAGYLSRTFKSIVGCNLSVFLVNCKLEEAARQMTEAPDRSITVIAEQLGYYTPAYFNRLFKSRYGTTPFQYQKRCQMLSEGKEGEEDTEAVSGGAE